jgi:hypothetical protein
VKSVEWAIRRLGPSAERPRLGSYCKGVEMRSAGVAWIYNKCSMLLTIPESGQSKPPLMVPE